MKARAQSLDLAIPDASPLAAQSLLAEQVQNALAKLDTAGPEEAKAIRDDAETLQHLLRSRNVAQASIYPVAELKLKAERAIGAQRLALPVMRGKPLDWQKAKELHEQGMSVAEIADALDAHRNSVDFALANGFLRSNRRPQRDRNPNPRITFDRNLGLIRPTAERWQHLAKIPDSQYVEVIQSLKAEGSDLSTNAVLYRANCAKANSQAVERNIYRLPDGRLQLRWKKDGVRHSEVTKTTDLAKARAILLRRKGLAGNTRKDATPDLHKAYANLRICLQAIDASLPKLNPSARRLAGAALTHGHKCEDVLSKALNVS